MDKLRIATAAFAILAGASVMSGSASAMPLNGQLPVATNTSTEIQQVRWVCGPYRCWWRPGPYYYWGLAPALGLARRMGLASPLAVTRSG